MISVIVPAYNAEKTIKDCLNGLLRQNYPKNKYEVIVVDDGSTDDTRKILKSFRRVKLVEQEHKGPAAARNLGVKHAKGNIVLFTDSDCVPDKNWIKHMIEPFKDKTIVGVSGTYKTLNKEKPIARFAGYEIEERHKKLKKEIDFIGTFSAGYRKNVFVRFGGFDESFTMPAGEDPELSFKINKAGLKMVFQSKAFVYTYHPDSLREFLRKKFWRSYWRVLLYKKYPRKIFRHSYTPKSVFLGTALTGLTVLLLFFGVLKIIPLFIGLISFILVFSLTLPLTFKIMKKDVQVGLLSPIIIILRDFFSGLGIVFGLIFLLRKK